MFAEDTLSARLKTAPTESKMRLPLSVGKDRLILTFLFCDLAIANYRGDGGRKLQAASEVRPP